jgi:hypothetical protein
MSFADFCKDKLDERNKTNEDESRRIADRLSILMQAVSCVEDIGLQAIRGNNYWQLVICTKNTDWWARIEQGVLNGRVWSETSNGDKYRVKLSNSTDPGYEYDSYITEDQKALNRWVRNKLADYAIDAGLIK